MSTNPQALALELLNAAITREGGRPVGSLSEVSSELRQLRDLLDEARRERAGMQRLAQKHRAALDAVAARLTPCCPPDVFNGFDLCPCGYGGTFPCPTTEAAWFARGLDPATEVRRVMDAVRPHEEG